MGMFMRRYGYKRGIHVGLTLFSIGAVMFWPSAVFHKYGSECTTYLADPVGG